MNLVWFIYPFHSPAVGNQGLEPWPNMLYKNTALPTELIPKRTNDDTARIAAPPPVTEMRNKIMK